MEKLSDWRKTTMTPKWNTSEKEALVFSKPEVFFYASTTFTICPREKPQNAFCLLLLYPWKAKAPKMREKN